MQYLNWIFFGYFFFRRRKGQAQGENHRKKHRTARKRQFVFCSPEEWEIESAEPRHKESEGGEAESPRIGDHNTDRPNRSYGPAFAGTFAAISGSHAGGRRGRKTFSSTDSSNVAGGGVGCA